MSGRRAEPVAHPDTRPASQRAPHPAARAGPRHVHTRPRSSHPRKQRAHVSRPRVRAKARPQTTLRPWRWNPTETSVVAATRVRWLAVYKLPKAKSPIVRLRNPDATGTQRVLLVHSTRRYWVHVYLPLRPNGSTGWVKADAVRLLRNPYRIVVRLRAHRLEVFRDRDLFVNAKIVDGKPSTPTPIGTFFVVDLLRPSDPNGAYGPFTYDLSAHSDVLKTFAGGDGHVAIHGTNEPWLLGQSRSHGCIRVSNAVIRKLERVLPLGTPVLIQR
jgi:lipoprotein-anchoring transpeptidase ErfK/SrfK